jgi:uncharacterized protein (DUF58 family)
MSRRLTRQASVLIGAGGILGIAATTAQAGWLFVLAAGVFGAVVASIPLSPRLDACRVTHAVPGRARAGDDVTVRVTVRNAHRRRTVTALRVEDLHPALEPARLFCDRLEAGEQAVAEHVRKALRRGAYSSGHTRLTSVWPFGVVASRFAIETASPIVVVPRWVRLGAFPLGPPAAAAPDTALERRRVGPGEVFAGVREYRAGDDVRKVHWRSTARRGQLVVREHSESAFYRVAVLLAGGDAGDLPDSAFEALAAAAASVALYGLDQGHPVELLRPAPDGGVERVSGGRNYLLAWLAGARATDSSLAALARAAAAGAPGGTVVACVPSHGRAGAELAAALTTLRAAGCHPVAVIADSASWDGRLPGPPAVERARARVLRRGQDVRTCLEG